MAVTLKFNRGLAAGLPSLAVGEPAFTTDTRRLYVGSSAGNINISGALGGVVGTTPGVTSSTGLRTSGTPATIAMATSSDDESGVITCTPGGSPATSALAATVTFSSAYTNTPKAVILTPANAAAQALLDTGAFPYVNDVDTTSALFKIYSGAVALTTGTAYRFHYKVCSAG